MSDIIAKVGEKLVEVEEKLASALSMGVADHSDESDDQLGRPKTPPRPQRHLARKMTIEEEHAGAYFRHSGSTHDQNEEEPHRRTSSGSESSEYGDHHLSSDGGAEDVENRSEDVGSRLEAPPPTLSAIPPKSAAALSANVRSPAAGVHSVSSFRELFSTGVPPSVSAPFYDSDEFSSDDETNTTVRIAAMDDAAFNKELNEAAYDVYVL
ncbi:unnamed protein product [Caenorhabditis auriculariae]|uniref:Uncharacterized protein n=1 Tax=Caenorhabditis auriculariae TaxID=2777116 RepID=A0A8S1GT26_9PELO|nr:unnamed protein product [Caenorhabditis auriculariae]